MKPLNIVKQELEKTEKKECRHDDVTYLYKEWCAQKDNGALCMLLIEELMIFLNAIDDGYTEELHECNNGCDPDRAEFPQRLEEALRYGLKHCLDNKYFVWRLCYYLSGIATYYYLLNDAIKTVEDAEELLQKLLDHVKITWQGSALFAQIKQEQFDKAAYEREFAAFDLQNNMVDEGVRWVTKHILAQNYL